MNKKIKIIVLTLLMATILIPNMVFAKENIKKKVEKKFTIDISNPDKKNMKKDNEFKVEVKKRENKELIKKEENTKNSKNINSEKELKKEDLNEALEKAKSEIQQYMTKPAKAKGTVTKNVGVDNKDYPIRKEIVNKSILESGVDTTNKIKKEVTEKLLERPMADKLQFVTFKTKTGKVFHLIIDHDKSNENVQLLTEVSEEDLLNMILTKDENIKKKIYKQEPKKEVDKKEEVTPIKKEQKEEKSDMGIYLIIGLVIFLVLGVGYYFKVIKVKDEEDLLDEEMEEDNFFSEAEEVDEYEEKEKLENMEDK